MFEARISHQGLHKFRVVRGYTAEEAKLKASLQLSVWEEQWARVSQSRQREQLKFRTVALKGQRKALASEQNAAAEKSVAAMDTLLQNSVKHSHAVDWSKLKHSLRYTVDEPSRPQSVAIPPTPTLTAPSVKLGFLGHFVPSVRARRVSEARAVSEKMNKSAYDAWSVRKNAIENSNKTLRENYDAAVNKFEDEKQTFIEQEELFNKSVDQKREAYLQKVPETVVEFCEMVLDSSEYPESFPSSFSVDYIPETRIVIVEFSLPSLDALPSIKGYKYVATRDEIQPQRVSDAWLNKTYDSVLYQITLRTLWELAQSDEADAMEFIVFNGWVNSVDKATGQEVNACVVTVQVTKAELLQIKMEQVDPKACFKKFKGVSAAKLVNLSPVRPILQLNKEDRRFVTAHDVIDSIDDSANLAAMDWEDFEHLIRDVFEKEFSSNGSEVKITQASRDGGVDAVAFDEDPIRGGKIVIQAKRYTNTVSVSAVRDLYGTLMNEGANKGILVTTADYGPDAYEFAKGKPITLLSGNELLYLLEKHGHKARINLAEARLLAAERDRAQTARSST